MARLHGSYLLGRKIKGELELGIALTALDAHNASGKTIGTIIHAQIRVAQGGGIGHTRLVV